MPPHRALRSSSLPLRNLAPFAYFASRPLLLVLDSLSRANLFQTMIFSKDYVGYLARQTTKHLVAAKMIKTDKPAIVNERVTAGLIDELSLEDRINDEVRVILEAFQDDMLKTGASYPEMFKKVKQELARKYKAVL